MRFNIPFSLPIHPDTNRRTAARRVLFFFWILLLTLLTSSALVDKLHAQWNPDPSTGGVWVAGADTTSEDLLATIGDGHGGVYVFWIGANPGNEMFRKPVVYGQHVDSTGESRWGSNGIVFSDTNRAAQTPGLVSDGAGGVIAAWQLQDFPVSEPDTLKTIQMVRIAMDGSVLWDQRLWDRRVYAFHPGYPPLLETDGAGGAYVLGVLGTFMTPNPTYLQRVSGNGTVLWPNEGALIRLAPAGIALESMIADGAGGVFLSWWDSRTSYYYNANFKEIYAQHVGPNGSISWNSNGNLIAAFASNPAFIYRNALAPDGNGGLFLAYSYDRPTPPYHNLVHIWSGGGIHWDFDMGFSNYRFFGIRLNQPWIIRSISPGKVALAKGNWIQVADTSLMFTWNNGTPVEIATDTVYVRELVPDGFGGVFAVSEYLNLDWPNFTSTELRVQKFSASGVSLWPEPGKPIATNAGTMKQIRAQSQFQRSFRAERSSVVPDGKGGAIVVWHEYPSLSSDSKTYASRFDPNGNPFPVEYETFIATRAGGSVQLLWRTASETNNRGFYIQRSLNRDRWTEIGFVPGNGTTGNPQEYAFTDALTPDLQNAGVLHYRLKQEDYDGTIEYSQERAVNVGSNPETPTLLPVYPNPAGVAISARFMLPNEMHVSTRIVNALGQVLYVTEKLYDTGWNSFDIPVAHFPSGVYYLQIQTGSGIQTEMFVKR